MSGNLEMRFHHLLESKRTKETVKAGRYEDVIETELFLQYCKKKTAGNAVGKRLCQDNATAHRTTLTSFSLRITTLK